MGTPNRSLVLPLMIANFGWFCSTIHFGEILFCLKIGEPQNPMVNVGYFFSLVFFEIAPYRGTAEEILCQSPRQPPGISHEEGRDMMWLGDATWVFKKDLLVYDNPIQILEAGNRSESSYWEPLDNTWIEAGNVRWQRNMTGRPWHHAVVKTLGKLPMDIVIQWIFFRYR